MSRTYHYETVTEAILQLRKKGYTLDFNLRENCLACHDGTFGTEDFEIEEVYRYEGFSDPADEATVYGIRSSSGLKGILVMGDELTMDAVSSEMLKKLRESI
ncbi:MAG: hypothetical protein M3Q97_04730 [Bacteroidota bacterium]|nr:hypothetical protein [Bacteroidota bacterium]